MRKTVIGTLALLLMLFTSCSKNGGVDAFVGRYSVSTVENVTWGGSSGTLTIVFGTGVLDGEVLTLSSTMSGQLASQGVLYPFYSTAQHTCIKQ